MLQNFKAQRLQPAHLKTPLFLISTVAILAGLVLAIVAWLHICSQECAATHKYRIYNMHFETIGLIFFPTLFILHMFSWKFTRLIFLTSLLLALALGSEIQFILVQKYMIGHWCPVCLSIASTIAIASIAYAIDYAIQTKYVIDQGFKGDIMLQLWKGLSTTVVVLLGFLFAFAGVGKINELKAAELSVKDSLAFGSLDSPVDIYLFTDWACPACRGAEHAIVTMMPDVMQKSRVTFVDFAIHPETLNYMPYNLSFMINNKGKYLKIRDALTVLSTEKGSPSDEDVEKAMKPLGVKYKQLNYADVEIGNKYFKHLADEFDIDSTPVMVIVNKSAKKGKKLFGGTEITKENVLKAIDSLQKEHP